VDYHTLDTLLNGKQTKLIKDRKKRIELQKGPANVIAVRLYDTDIVQFWPSDDIRLQTGGWSTKFTMEIMNDYLPDGMQVVIEKHRWFLMVYGQKTLFYEGMVVDECGRPSPDEPDIDEMWRDDAEMTRAIDKYSRRIDKDALLQSKAQTTNACWICQGVVEDSNPKTHYQTHLDEQAVPWPLIVRACREANFTDCATEMWMQNKPAKIQGAVRKFLMRKLLHGTVDVSGFAKQEQKF
jgi:hypothetical protein